MSDIDTNTGADSIDPQDPGQCRRCGDPLPADGKCDCAGDRDRDYVSGWQGMNAHAVVVRLGPKTGYETRDGDLDSVAEVWL